MPKTSWDILVERSTRHIELDHDTFANDRTIRVDGVEVALDPRTRLCVVGEGSIDRFEVAGLACEVVIRPRAGGLGGYERTLVVDGKVHPTGALPEYPRFGTRRPWWARAIEAAPRAVAAFCVVGMLGSVLFAAYLTNGYIHRPKAPIVVPIGASASVDDDAWVELVGLSVDCSTSFENDRYHYRVAGRDETGATILTVTDGAGRCLPDHARGELSVPGGTSGTLLRRTFRDDRLRVLYTYAGPSNDVIGIGLMVSFTFVWAFLAAFAWVRRGMSR